MNHNRLIADAARGILSPLGLRQKGRSRTWLDDHGWWLIVVEFQPSDWTRGSYLNVGAMWLWHPTDHFSFEFGDRVAGLQRADDAAQFTALGQTLATTAAERVQQLRRQLATPVDVANTLLNRPNPGEWLLLHGAIAAALAGKVDRAKHAFSRMTTPGPTDPDWRQRLFADARALEESLDSPSDFRAQLQRAVATSRNALRLPPAASELPAENRAAI